MLEHWELMRRFGAEAFISLTYRPYAEQVVPAIALGLVAIGCAEIWGRRQPAPDLTDVFS
jgi:hypothetical protein